jgi:hypothetical protein
VVTRLGNPALTWLLSGPRRAAKVGRSLLLLHVTGRRTGRLYTTPVAYHRQADGSLLVLTSSRWRVNLRGEPTPVGLTVLGRRVAATAVLDEDPFVVAEVYQQLIGAVGLDQAGRRLGIRINVERAPTYEELVDAVRREHLSVLRLTVSADQP